MFARRHVIMIIRSIRNCVKCITTVSNEVQWLWLCRSTKFKFFVNPKNPHYNLTSPTEQAVSSASLSPTHTHPLITPSHTLSNSLRLFLKCCLQQPVLYLALASSFVLCLRGRMCRLDRLTPFSVWRNVLSRVT